MAVRACADDPMFAVDLDRPDVQELCNHWPPHSKHAPEVTTVWCHRQQLFGVVELDVRVRGLQGVRVGPRLWQFKFYWISGFVGLN